MGRLIQPRHYSSIRETALSGMPWAADNDCFQGLDTDAFARMLDTIQGLPGCLFVTVPDVVADAQATAALFDVWAPALERRGLPVALVAQDGLEHMEPWLRSQWHRYIRVMAHTEGYRIGEVKVPYRPRESGLSKFGLGRQPVSDIDEVTLNGVSPGATKKAFFALDSSTISFASSTTRKRSGGEPVDTDKLLK